MLFRIVFLLALTGLVSASELQEESDIKFALYSAAWGENAVDDLRIVARNDTNNEVRIDSITFLKDEVAESSIELKLALEVPALGYADLQVEYVDLLLNNDCIERTLAENWRLAEISNHTLNPSVRNLIIEDTDSFRIYQCVEFVNTRWTNLSDGSAFEQQEWVLFHFESRSI